MTVPLEFCAFVLVLLDAGFLAEPGEIERLVGSRCWQRRETVEAT